MSALTRRKFILALGAFTAGTFFAGLMPAVAKHNHGTTRFPPLPSPTPSPTGIVRYCIAYTMRCFGRSSGTVAVT